MTDEPLADGGQGQRLLQHGLLLSALESRTAPCGCFTCNGWWKATMPAAVN